MVLRELTLFPFRTVTTLITVNVPDSRSPSANVRAKASDLRAQHNEIQQAGPIDQTMSIRGITPPVPQSKHYLGN